MTKKVLRDRPIARSVEHRFEFLSELFMKSKGQPIEIDGEAIHAMFSLSFSPGKHLLEVRKISFKPALHPGLAFRIKDGSMLIAGQKLERFNLWAESSPEVAQVLITARKNCRLNVWNIWSVNGATDAWVGQAGMKISTCAMTSELACSGGSTVRDFGCLVVELEQMEAPDDDRLGTEV